MNKEPNIYSFADECYVYYGDYKKDLEEKDKEIERLKNIIYTTLEYVDREEVNSIGTPYTYTEIGKNIKELLEGERTFNSIWKENKSLNNIINELEKYHIKSMENLENTEDFKYVGTNHIKILYEEHKRTLDKLKELKEGKE